MNTYKYILKKYNLHPKDDYFIEIPDMGRGNLAELFAELGFTKGAEIGVEEGAYSEILCKVNPKLHLFCIDPWSPSAYEPEEIESHDKQNFFDEKYELSRKRLALYNCTILRKTSMEAIKDFPDGCLDFVYIDGNHDFINIAKDLHYWLKKIRIGGIISGHDFANFPSKKYNHVKKVVEVYARCYHTFPYFIAGTDNAEGTQIRDKYRSWFWVKK